MFKFTMFKFTVGFILMFLIVANRERENDKEIALDSHSRCAETLGNSSKMKANMTETMGEGEEGEEEVNVEQECKAVAEGDDKAVCEECSPLVNKKMEFGNCMRSKERANLRVRFWDNPTTRTTRSIVRVYWAGVFRGFVKMQMSKDTYVDTACKSEEGEAQAHQQCRSNVIRSDNTPSYYSLCEFHQTTLTECTFTFMVEGLKSEYIGSIIDDKELGKLHWVATPEAPGVLVREFPIKMEGIDPKTQIPPVAFITVLPRDHLNDILNGCLRLHRSILLPMIIVLPSLFRLAE